MTDTKLTVNKHGSLRITGEFTIYDAQGQAFDLAGRNTVSLCRCGHSDRKPFCDGSHRKFGFQSEVRALRLPAPAARP